MSFSARQLHCMEAMGLVAWSNIRVSAPSSSGDSPVTLVKTTTAIASNRAEQASPAGTDSIVPGEMSLVELAGWLVEQPLVAFEQRGSVVCCSGSDKASVLVVCLYPANHQELNAQLPMTSESSQMFDLMMHAIDMPRSALRQCVVRSGQSNAADAASVGSLCTPPIRAVLALDSGLRTVPGEISAESSLLPVSSIPLWRVPHPDNLMQLPALKRLAWETLKDMRRALAG